MPLEIAVPKVPEESRIAISAIFCLIPSFRNILAIYFARIIRIQRQHSNADTSTIIVP